MEDDLQRLRVRRHDDELGDATIQRLRRLVGTYDRDEERGWEIMIRHAYLYSQLLGTNESRCSTLAFLELLVIAGLLDQLENILGQLGVSQRISLGIHFFRHLEIRLSFDVKTGS